MHSGTIFLFSRRIRCIDLLYVSVCTVYKSLMSTNTESRIRLVIIFWPQLSYTCVKCFITLLTTPEVQRTYEKATERKNKNVFVRDGHGPRVMAEHLSSSVRVLQTFPYFFEFALLLLKKVVIGNAIQKCNLFSETHFPYCQPYTINFV